MFTCSYDYSHELSHGKLGHVFAVVAPRNLASWRWLALAALFHAQQSHRRHNFLIPERFHIRWLFGCGQFMQTRPRLIKIAALPPITHHKTVFKESP